MDASLPRRLGLALSFNGGYVDTAGFLALHGLFTAHVTGNFVTLGAALVHGSQGAVSKLLALPVFCLVVALSRLASVRLSKAGTSDSAMQTLLWVKVVLLGVGAVLAISHGPFADADSAAALLTGLVLVAAMAIQNAVHRMHLASEPPTTLMTGTTTQIMIDVADLLHGAAPDQAKAARARLGRMGRALAAFAIGCGTGALAFAAVDNWSFAGPTAVALWTAFLSRQIHTARPTELA
jgi:uncharacterized membrane protein YoaK (UPF0700 family)